MRIPRPGTSHNMPMMLPGPALHPIIVGALTHTLLECRVLRVDVYFTAVRASEGRRVPVDTFANNQAESTINERQNIRYCRSKRSYVLTKKQQPRRERRKATPPPKNAPVVLSNKPPPFSEHAWHTRLESEPIPPNPPVCLTPCATSGWFFTAVSPVTSRARSKKQRPDKGHAATSLSSLHHPPFLQASTV